LCFSFYSVVSSQSSSPSCQFPIQSLPTSKQPRDNPPFFSLPSALLRPLSVKLSRGSASLSTSSCFFLFAHSPAVFTSSCFPRQLLPTSKQPRDNPGFSRCPFSA
jgi:hypothetical protein